MDYNEYAQKKAYLQQYKQQLRQKERSLNARAKALSSAPIVGANSGVQKLESDLRSFLPESHMPGNIGGINRVAWQFWYNFDFDFGTDPAMNNTINQIQEVMVSQEACFIAQAVYRNSFSEAVEEFPFCVEIKDRQSSRYINDAPIPLQYIGTRSKPMIFTTPFLIFPNAKLEIKMSNYLPDGVTQDIVGAAKLQLTLFGYRVRVEDADKVLSSIFGQL